MFSVIIPTLNEERFLPQLLASLAAQIDRDFEVIVVDGSSKDKTVSLAKTYAKKLPKLTVIVSKTASLPLQRNMGARVARGEWLVFADADGQFLPYFMTRCREYIREFRPHVFTPWARSDSENPKDAVYSLFYNIYSEGMVIFRKPFTSGPMTLVRKDAFDKIHGYDERHAFHEDVDFGIRLAKAGYHMKILRETLFVWSLRRFRKQGTLKVMNKYLLGMLPVFLINRSFTKMPGYDMGGHMYKKRSLSFLRVYEKKFRALLTYLHQDV